MLMTNRRYPELDLLRGLAVLAMITYHLCFDLSFYYGFDIPITTDVPAALAHSIATVFLILIGICFVISWERTAEKARLRKYAQRALVIFAGAMIVSAVTWLIDPQTFVIFGILHLVAVSTLIQYILRPLKRWNLLLGILIILAAFTLPAHSVTTPLLLPFGIMTKNFMSVDYYPLLPWLGPVLIGMGLGDVFYIPERHKALSVLDSIRWPRWILWIGRKSLWIYFVHQPVILLVLWMLLGM